MCTAISFLSGHHYFGRNLDLEYHYQESVTITPRNYPLNFRETHTIDNHYAIIGIATVVNDYPLYYDATNEHGLSVAALNFPGNAVYNSVDKSKTNISSFELIPYILGKYGSVNEVKQVFQEINIVDIPFNNELPVTPLHWLVADRTQSITVEQTNDGIQIYDNPINVLTNNPPFPYHLENIRNYLNLTANEPKNRFSTNIDISAYSRGMGAIGLPGDVSSASRFIRAAFVLHNSKSENSEEKNISQFFHILGSVEQQKGCVCVGDLFEETIYTSCCDTDFGIYYYTTYNNRQITAVNMYRHDIDGADLITFPLKFEQQIFWDDK